LAEQFFDEGSTTGQCRQRHRRRPRCE